MIYTQARAGTPAVSACTASDHEVVSLCMPQQAKRRCRGKAEDGRVPGTASGVAKCHRRRAAPSHVQRVPAHALSSWQPTSSIARFSDRCPWPPGSGRRRVLGLQEDVEPRLQLALEVRRRSAPLLSLPPELDEGGHHRLALLVRHAQGKHSVRWFCCWSYILLTRQNLFLSHLAGTSRSW